MSLRRVTPKSGVTLYFLSYRIYLISNAFYSNNGKDKTWRNAYLLVHCDFITHDGFHQRYGCLPNFQCWHSRKPREGQKNGH